MPVQRWGYFEEGGLLNEDFPIASPFNRTERFASSSNPLTSVMRSAVLLLTTGIDATADFESLFRFFYLPPIAPKSRMLSESLPFSGLRERVQIDRKTTARMMPTRTHTVTNVRPLGVLLAFVAIGGVVIRSSSDDLKLKCWGRIGL